MRTVNEAGIEVVKSFEGLEDGDPSTVNLDPYVCPAGVWTIGWGHAIFYNGDLLRINNPDSKEIASSLYPGGITKEEATELLQSDLVKTALQVEKAVTAPLTDNQFGALVSFTYNVGIGNLKASTLLKKLNSGDYIGAADEFPKWRRANGIVLNGLVKRRAAERNLFLKNN